MHHFLVLSAQDFNHNTSLVIGFPVMTTEYNAELLSQVCDRLN